LEQVQTRDKIKMKLILEHGSTYYIVKDLGKFNKEFVINEFNLFIYKLNFKPVINQLFQK
jgi:hypothetical protein